MQIAELLIPALMLGALIGGWRLVAAFYASQGHPPILGNFGGALVGVIGATLVLIVAAPAPAPATATADPAPETIAVAAADAEALPRPVAPPLGVPEVAPPSAPEPAAAAPAPAAEPPVVAVAAPPAVPEAAAPAATEDARLAYCADLAGRASAAEKAAARRFGSASESLKPGEEIIAGAATAASLRSDAVNRPNTSDSAPASEIAAGTRIKIHQRFGRPGEWVWYQVHLPEKDEWRYTTSRALAWVDRSARGEAHERSKRQWIEAEKATDDPALRARATRERWSCSQTQSTNRS